MLQIGIVLTNSFLQRFVLSAFIGIVLALGIQFYRHIIQAGDDALNSKYRKPAAQAPPLDPGLNQGGARRR
jgi:hypothetical protein